MSCTIKLTNVEATHTAVVRGCVGSRELPDFIRAACGEVWSFVRAAGIPRPGRHVAVYLDGKGSVDVGAEVGDVFSGNGRVHCSQLPAGRVVTTTHFGPYHQLSEAHAAIRLWCAEHGHRLAGISWEIYGHWEECWNADPSKIRTDVFWLVTGE